MKTTDIALAAFLLNPDPGAGREPLAQDGPPFGDLLSLMDRAAPALRQDGAARPDTLLPETPEPPVTEPRATGPVPSLPAASLDLLLAHCAHAHPENADGDTPALPDAEPVAAADTEADPESDAPVCELPGADTFPPPQPVPLVAAPPAAQSGDMPRADMAPRERARPMPVSAGPQTEPADAPEPMRIAVLRRETHFAPVRFSPPPASPSLPVTPTGTQRETATGEPTGPLEADAPSPPLALPEIRAPQRPAPQREAADDAPEPQSRHTAFPPNAAPERAAAAPIAQASKPQPPIKAEASPALPFASLAQVGRAIAAEVAQIDPSAPVIAAGAASEAAGSSTPAGPVRVLDIALSPETLGRVVVHMRLTPHGLAVRLKADNPATAELLANDKEHLSALLTSAGLPDVDLEVGGPGLSLLDAPVRSRAEMEAAPRQETPDHPQGGSRGGADPGRQGRNGRQDRTWDEDAAPSYPDEPRAGAR